MYYVNYRFVLQSRSNGETEADALMFVSLYCILMKYQLCCQVSKAGTDFPFYLFILFPILTVFVITNLALVSTRDS